jgi:hypothetical protein
MPEGSKIIYPGSSWSNGRHPIEVMKKKKIDLFYTPDNPFI